jgi:hypothetical protein
MQDTEMTSAEEKDEEMLVPAAASGRSRSTRW